MKKSILHSFAAFLTLAIGIAGCTTDHVVPIPEPARFAVTTIDTTLRSPIGLEMDGSGNLWIAEIGTGNNDGAIVMFTPGGQKTTVISGFHSAAGPESNEGLSHIKFVNGKLYILHGIDGILYVADISGFKAGDPQIQMTSLQQTDFGTYSRSLNLTDPVNSNIFDMEFDAAGNAYVVDAGANAIFKWDKSTGNISLFAKIPSVAGGTIDAVPTGIVFDGSKFLVSSLTGFPFAPGNAKIFAVDLNGNVSIYKDGFTMLTHIELSANNKPIVTKFSDFALPKGFVPFSGAILNEDGTVLAGGLMMPTDIRRTGDRQFHVISFALGQLYKLTY